MPDGIDPAVKSPAAKRYKGGRQAEPVTLLMRGENGGLQRHAAYRQPLSHPDAHLIDRMAAAGVLTAQHHHNAAALLHLFRAAGLDPALSARYAQHIRGSADDGVCWVSRYKAAMAMMTPRQAELASRILREQDITFRDLPDLLDGLERLDKLAAEFDVMRWAAEEDG